MKLGLRTPNIKKSIKAKTTGKIVRKAKRGVNPLYGSKNIGYIKNPKKALYNKIYNKTTISAFKWPNTKNIFVNLIWLVFYLYYLLFKYCLYIPIKWIINKIKK